jgi:hypothetical protein
MLAAPGFSDWLCRNIFGGVGSKLLYVTGNCGGVGSKISKHLTYCSLTQLSDVDSSEAPSGVVEAMIPRTQFLGNKARRVGVVPNPPIFAVLRSRH